MAIFFTRFFMLMILFFGLVVPEKGISQIQETVSGESIASLFSRARKLAFDGKREEAQTLCSQILQRKPNHYDARILMGRTFSWDKNYDRARAEFKKVLEAKYGYRDAVLAIIDVENWSGNYTKALFYCDYGLSFHPNDEVLLLRKAQMHYKLGQERLTAQHLNNLLEIYPGNEKGRILLKEVKFKRMKYKGMLVHNFEFFDEPYIRRWHLSSVQLQRKFSGLSLIGKVNFGDLIREGEKLWQKEISKQFELDAYLRLSPKNYAYLNYGFSEDRLFPNHRAGAELYQKLPGSFEASLGARFLRFNKSDGGHSEVYIFTGSLGKYYRNYWFSFRPYITPKEKSFSRSFNFTTRRYFKNARNYIGLEVGTGTSPDELRGNIGDIAVYRFKSRKAKLSYQDQLFTPRLLYLLRAGMEREEYNVSDYRNIYTLSLKMSYQF